MDPNEYFIEEVNFEFTTTKNDFSGNEWFDITQQFCAISQHNSEK